jgi:DNA-binding NarL/FixJ family response regulator
MPRMLIVDDHALIRRGVQLILEPYPEWQLCGEAENGQEAIMGASNLRPDVIIMDISMPVLDGIEAAEVISQKHPDIKIILLTLYDSEEIIRKAFQAGARGYVSKADADQELLKALRTVGEKNVYISSRIDERISKSILVDFCAAGSNDIANQ